MRLLFVSWLSFAVACGAARPADTTTTTVTYAPPGDDSTGAPAGAGPAAPSPVASTLVTLRAAGDAARASVWRVFADGRAARLAYDFPAVRHESVFGTTAPVASRDGRQVAFVKDGALSVLDVSALVARPLGQAAVGQDLLVSAWSPDGANVLVHVGGAYRYVSLATGASSDVPVDGEVVGFFPDGTLAVLAKDGRTLSRAAVGSAALAVLFRSPAYMEQLALSPDGRSAACGVNVDDVDRVLRIDLTAGATTTVADGSSGRAAQNPWPSFSPTSGRLAWLEEPPLAKNEDAVRVALEGGAAVEVGGARISRFHWIDDGTLALESEGRLVVADVATGSIRGRTDLR